MAHVTDSHFTANSITLTRLDEDGNPTGEPADVVSLSHAKWSLVDAWDEADYPPISLKDMSFDFTMEFPLDWETYYHLMKTFTGMPDRKIRRWWTKAARMQRHRGYQSSRKVRRR